MNYGFYGFKIHKIHNPWMLKWIWNGLPKSIIHMDYVIFNLNPYGFFMDFKSIMDYGFFMEWVWIWF